MITYIPKTFGVSIGYDIIADGGEGSIFIRERGGFYFLHGFNNGINQAFCPAMRKIIGEFDELFGADLYIIRSTGRTDISSLYKKFGFNFLLSEAGKNVYKRDARPQ